MDRDRIEIICNGGTRLVAERNPDPNYDREIFIGLEDESGAAIQTLAIVRQMYGYQEFDPVWVDDQFQVLVYNNPEIDDYMDLINVCKRQVDKDNDGTNTYRAEIDVDPRTSMWIDEILNNPAKSKETCFGENETYMRSVDFCNGYEMDIKICGVRFDPDSDNLPWAEAVLFYQGAEVACSEVSETFFGEWTLMDDDKTFVVVVKSAEQKRKEE